jgi:hypothetical protein
LSSVSSRIGGEDLHHAHLQYNLHRLPGQGTNRSLPVGLSLQKKELIVRRTPVILSR